MPREHDVIKVAVTVGKGIMVHAKGNPALIVACAAAAGIATICTGIGYGAYWGGRKLLGLEKQ